MDIVIPDYVQAIFDSLQNAGHQAFLVGGCVRDALRGVEPADYDIATSATPAMTAAALCSFETIPTGLEHGTVTALSDGHPIEITTFRIDGQYRDHRRPEKVEFADDIAADLARRDFTINAMAYHPSTGLVDPYGGLRDLDAQIIRCVGDPMRRFEEDALRVLRGARFASQLGFSIEGATARAMAASAHYLSAVSAERIFAELMKALLGQGLGRTFREHPYLLVQIIPEMAASVGFAQDSPYHIYDVYEHTLRAVDASPTEPIIRLTMLLHDVGKPACFSRDEAGVGHFKGHAELSATMADAILRRLRCQGSLREAVCELILYHNVDLHLTHRSVRRWLRRVGEKQVRRLIAIKIADDTAKAPHIYTQRRDYYDSFTQLLDEVIAHNEAFSLAQLDVDGDALIALGIPQGPLIGQILAALLSEVIEEDLANEAGALLDRAIELYHMYNT